MILSLFYLLYLGRLYARSFVLMHIRWQTFCVSVDKLGNKDLITEKDMIKSSSMSKNAFKQIR